jgi:adenylylsulfate kinase
MSWAIWVTGLPGSGKSTVARAAAGRLAERGIPVTVLELDQIRRVVTPTPACSAAERETVYRALVFMAVALTEAGVPVLIDATAHRRAWRQLARASIACFAEVRLHCSLDVARVREGTRPRGAAPADIYARAGRPGATVPGVDVAYEASPAAELTIDTGTDDPATAAERVAVLGQRLAASATQPTGADGVVVWITGPPGSGKTTLARRLAEALTAEGAAVSVLEWLALRALVFHDGPVTEAEEEIAHRALAYTAKLLADAGRTVVVDATAPRRAWRALARTLTGAFAEVQLVCPAETCLDRERAVRWGRQPCPRPARGTPDFAVEYEYSLTPDLLLDTATRSEWTGAEDVLRLVRRLTRQRLAGQEVRPCESGIS